MRAGCTLQSFKRFCYGVARYDITADHGGGVLRISPSAQRPHWPSYTQEMVCTFTGVAKASDLAFQDAKWFMLYKSSFAP